MDPPKTIAEARSTTVCGCTVGQPLAKVRGLTSGSAVSLFLLSQHFDVIELCSRLRVRVLRRCKSSELRSLINSVVNIVARGRC
jgi:hypothetical protein